MNKECLIEKILNLEWDLFRKVNNPGGKAPCQENPAVFRIMRESQYASWSGRLLENVLADLEKAVENGRNPVQDKYMRMTERTFPEEYQEYAALLPRLGPGILQDIDEIISIHMDWQRDLQGRYPCLCACGRKTGSAGEKRGEAPSMETYFRAELASLSPETVRIYLEEIKEKLGAGRNEAEENLLNQVKFYGMASLEEAEGKLAALQALRQKDTKG